MGGGNGHAVPLRQRMLEELSSQLDMARIHFLGRVPHPVLMALLQASWVHVYLSYPICARLEPSRGDGMWVLHCWQSGDAC